MKPEMAFHICKDTPGLVVELLFHSVSQTGYLSVCALFCSRENWSFVHYLKKFL